MINIYKALAIYVKTKTNDRNKCLNYTKQFHYRHSQLEKTLFAE